MQFDLFPFSIKKMTGWLISQTTNKQLNNYAVCKQMGLD